MSFVRRQRPPQCIVPLIDVFQRLLRVSLLDRVEAPGNPERLLVRSLVEDQPQDDELQVRAQRRVAVDGAHDVQQSQNVS
jgi:hypothetical protein